jgi:hypothetical protein
MLDLAGIMAIPHMPTLLSFILGFGIACIFRPLCKGPDCIIQRGPPVSELRGSVYQFGSKCIEFIPKPMECPKKEEKMTIVETVEAVAF